MKQISRIQGTLFQEKLWFELTWIPEGENKSYKEIAAANACSQNPHPIIISCHRAIRSDDSLGGFSTQGGTATKRRLLGEEQKA